MRLDFPRTQNSVEAWHRRLKIVVGKRHSGLYKLIEDLGKELIVTKSILGKLESGEAFKKIIKNIKKSKRLLKKK